MAEKNYLEMSKFSRSMSSISIDVGMVMGQRPKVFQTLMADIFQMYEKGTIKEISPITTYSISRIQDAMQLIYARKHKGKVVIKVRDSDMVHVSNLKASAPRRCCSPNA